MAEVFPVVLGSNWAFLSETLAYKGEGSELTARSYDYPILNLQLAFAHERWVEGYGTGVTSLGNQYVARFLDQPVPDIGVGNRLGTFIWELGRARLGLWGVLSSGRPS